MLESVKNALKVKEVRSKLLFTFMALLIVRVGCAIPVYGIDHEVFSQWYASFEGRGFLDALTGGSFSHLSIFALNISPYITASIIMQLLTIVFPSLEELQKDGATGQKKIAEYSRYMTVVLAVIESIALVISFSNYNYLDVSGDKYKIRYLIYVVIILSFTAGSAFLMWLGEQITEKGVGNGISIILLINIVATMPADFGNIFNKYVLSPTAVINRVIGAIGIVVVIIAVVALVVMLQDAQRKIPVQYAQKVQGRQMVGGKGSFIPLKVNTANVIPVIFAISLMQTPVIVLSFMGITGARAHFWPKVAYLLSSRNWFNMSSWGEFKYTLGALIYVALLIVFAYFYTSITFNPVEVANNMKKQGGFIPGIRPGRPTTEYLTTILNYIIFIGAIGLTIVSLLPMIFAGVSGVTLSFGGTSIIIVVSVILETLNQIDSMLLVRQYKGFLND